MTSNLFAPLIPSGGEARPTHALPKSAARKPKPTGRRRQGKHRRIAVLGMPTPQAKAGEIAASRAAADEIFRRKIRGVRPLGDVRVQYCAAVGARTGRSLARRSYFSMSKVQHFQSASA